MNSGAFRSWLGICLLAWALSDVGTGRIEAAAAPQIQSSTPADGATDVPVSTPLILVFDRDMDTLLPAQTALGNLSIQPANLGAQLMGSWGADKRTMTIQLFFGTWPLNATIVWTLNPSGVNSFLQIKAADGTPLPTVSGSFSTGVGALALGSVFPPDGDESVPTNATVTFRFNQPMKTIPLPGGTPPAVRWTGTGLDAAKFQYTWSADARSLSVVYSGGFPLNSLIGWELNPAGAPTILESQSGKALPSSTYSGTFHTAASGACVVENPFAGWGGYGINKRSNFTQTSAADPVESGESGAFVFSAVVESPPLGTPVVGGSVTRPDNSSEALVPSGFFSFYETAASEAELDALDPAGTYSLRFTQTGVPEWVIPMNLKASDTPPIPKIVNFTEAQSVNPAQDFTLRWTSFSNGAEGDLIHVLLYSDQGDVVFQAPEFCIPIPLKPTDTSVVVPAGTLSGNRTYNAELLFGKSFYSSTNTVPKMYGYAYRLRSTSFTVSTGGGTTPTDPAVLSGARILPDGTAAFDLRGTPGKTYSILKADRLDAASWPEVGTVQTDVGGAGVYQTSQALGTAPQFYRATPR
ncbi:MAG: Ig-like domain-containing protein [Verrucomicrobiales bacterium]|nr:Ig-like domain-containing protein [Verrucomicrobiales bacterium]